jgi:hypothetical protein
MVRKEPAAVEPMKIVVEADLEADLERNMEAS